jgi:hypothetical protein
MRIFKPALLLLVTCNTGTPAFADDHRQHGAHEHGIGKLNIAQEGREIRLELDSPAANIVGFEHVPGTEADHDILEKAMARLRDGTRMFLFPAAAACRLAEARVETPLMDENGDEPPGHEEHRAHDDDDPHGHDGETHADITADYRFTCAHPEKLDQVTVQLFETFPMTERLQVQFIIETRQGAAELSASQPVLRF